MHNDLEVGALFGFCSETMKITSLFDGAVFMAAFDSSKKTFRNEIYAPYKEHRKPMPEKLVQQLPMMRQACQKFGFAIMEKEGFEADDVIASIAVSLHQTHKIKVISSDKDLMQLLALDGIEIYDPARHKYITHADAFSKFGTTADKILDVMSLIGDSSDGIPGLPGIGPKTASALINKFGSLDGLIANLGSLSSRKKDDSIKRNIHLAILSRKLAALRCDLQFDNVNTEGGHYSQQELSEFFEQYGFDSLIKRITKDRISSG
jgi:DNA polymerase-1